MDRWFLCKNLFKWLESINFNWVTKAQIQYSVVSIDRGTMQMANPVLDP
jgi:hypothetical protein